MPLYPDPWSAYKAYHAHKKACLDLDKQIHELGLDIIKQVRELEGLQKADAEASRKASDDSLSQIVRDFHKDELRRNAEARRRATAWLAVNRAKVKQLQVEFDINADAVGRFQKDLWTSEDEQYAAFRQTLENADYQ